MGIRIGLLLSLLPLILLGITGNAFAGPTPPPEAGSDTGNAASSELLIQQDGGDSNSVGPNEVSACDPVSSCPPIVKEFDYANEGASGLIFLHEEWIVGPGPPWWDWHEVIQTAGWTFQQVEIQSTNGAPCPAVGQITNPLPPQVITNNGQVIWIDFDDVPNVGLLHPGDRLCIWKELNANFPTSPFFGTLVIWEWPTIHKMAVGGEFIPIDATAVLIAGAQSNALTILSAFVVIGAIAFGALVISVKRKHK